MSLPSFRQPEDPADGLSFSPDRTTLVAFSFVRETPGGKHIQKGPRSESVAWEKDPRD